MRPDGKFSSAAHFESAGHYVTSGATIGALGLLGMGMAAALSAFAVPMHFIDASSMSITSVGFLCIGAVMMRHGRSLR